MTPIREAISQVRQYYHLPLPLFSIANTNTYKDTNTRKDTERHTKIQTQTNMNEKKKKNNKREIKKDLFLSG